jgi:hypothetical protein
MENLNLKIEKAEGELIIRTGAAAVIKEPKAVVFKGTFQAVINYWLKRKVDVVKDLINRCRLEFSKTEMSIKLIIDEHKDYQDVIEGSMLKNPDLTSFGINNETTWTLEALHKQIKLKKHLFHSPDQYHDLLTKLVNQKANINTDLDKSHDNRGNKKNSFERKVETNLPDKFDLILAPYKGYDTIQFSVEIYVDSKESSLIIQLFSPELVEKLLELQDNIMNKALEQFEEIPVMEK